MSNKQKRVLPCVLWELLIYTNLLNRKVGAQGHVYVEGCVVGGTSQKIFTATMGGYVFRKGQFFF